MFGETLDFSPEERKVGKFNKDEQQAGIQFSSFSNKEEKNNNLSL